MPGPIPRVIHQIWLNGEPPDTLKRLQDRMMRFNPSYDLRVWGPEHFPPLYNAKQYAEVEGMSFKCDVVRYEILWRFPGIYIDWDVIFWRGFDDIFGDAGCSVMPDNFFVREHNDKINNAIYGVGPGSPIAAALVERLERSSLMHKHPDVGGRSMQSGVEYFTSVVRSFPETAVILPKRTFHSGLPYRCAMRAAQDPRYATLANHFYNNMPGMLDAVEDDFVSGKIKDSDVPPPRPAMPPSARRSPKTGP